MEELVYEYEAMDNSGTEVTGSVRATSKDLAHLQIKQLGFFPTRIFLPFSDKETINNNLIKIYTLLGGNVSINTFQNDSGLMGAITYLILKLQRDKEDLKDIAHTINGTY